MTYSQFKVVVAEVSIRQLRCDEPPTDALLAIMDRVGIDRYERYVLRLEAERSRKRPARTAWKPGDGILTDDGILATE